MTERYDAIVIGLGAMGSAATYQLAKRGQRVLGIDAFADGHAQGSSHGHHRMIRRSHTRAQLRPLVDRAFELWRELEDESGADIMNLIGEVCIQTLTPTALPVSASHPTQDFREVLDEQQLRERFPGFRLRPGMIATYEREAGNV